MGVIEKPSPKLVIIPRPSDGRRFGDQARLLGIDVQSGFFAQAEHLPVLHDLVVSQLFANRGEVGVVGMRERFRQIHGVVLGDAQASFPD